MLNKRTIIYIGYKEPLTKLAEKYFGYEGVTLEDEKTGEQQCCICGNFYKALAFHIVKSHKDVINVDPRYRSNGIVKTYKDMFGLKQGRSLVSKKVSNKIKKTRKTDSKELIKNRSKNLTLGNDTGRNNNQVAEIKNQKGICHLQLIDLIRKKAIKLGRIPTGREMRGYSGQDILPTIKKTFGSWSEALTIARLLKKNHVITDKERLIPKWFLLQLLETYYNKNGARPKDEEYDGKILPKKEVFIKQNIL